MLKSEGHQGLTTLPSWWKAFDTGGYGGVFQLDPWTQAHRSREKRPCGIYESPLATFPALLS